MNREIKFRFWLSHTKKMTYSHSLEEVSKVIPEFSEDIIPLQYTGLHDRTGKEIYEGDIIKAKFNANIEENFQAIHSLSWDGMHNEIDSPFMSAWGATCGRYFYTFMNVYDPTRFAEVIGNIYENPDLLKQL